MSQKCKNKADEIKQDKEEKEKVEREDENYMPDTFQAITQDVRREVQEQLESEGKLHTISNADLNNHIGDMLKEVLGIEKISKNRIEEVMFLSESEKKTSGSESDVSVSNDAQEENEEEKAKKEESDETEEEVNPENDLVLFIDDEDTILFNDMKGYR